MADRPNILFIFSDQQRWDSVGCYGQSLPTTPHLDEMAAEGVRFEHAFTPQPLCTPARACLHTGRYATEVDTWMLSMALPTDELTTAHRLRRAGYETGYIGKWHLATTSERYARPGNRPGQSRPFDCRTAAVPRERRGGFDDFWQAADCLEHTSHGFDGYLFDGDGRRLDMPDGQYRVDWLTDLAVDYLHTRSGERPFYLFLSYIEPHWQNDQSTHPVPDELVAPFRDFDEPGDLAGSDSSVKWLGGRWRTEYPRYLACVHSLDRAVGRLLAELGQLGLTDDTLVMYSSDHGCHFGQRNPGAKDSCHDASIRVPMIARGPGFAGGREVEELVSLVDVAPTLLQGAGVAPPKSMRGRALQALAAGEACNWPEEVFCQISPSTLGRCIRTRDWAFSAAAPGISGWDESAASEYVPDYLYDLRTDPHQRHNLVGDPEMTGIREQLAARLGRRMSAAGERDFRIRLD